MFSHMSPCFLIAAEQVFHTVEHAYQFLKYRWIAKMCSDRTIGDQLTQVYSWQLVEDSDPIRVKKRANQIMEKMIVQDLEYVALFGLWHEEHARKVLFELTWRRFHADATFRDLCLKHSMKQFFEITKDSDWGIGVEIQPGGEITDSFLKGTTGENWAGKVLMSVIREYLYNKATGLRTTPINYIGELKL